MINWPDIDTVLLDMDGTLLDLHFDNFFWTDYVPRTYAKKHNLSDVEAFEHLNVFFDQNRGTLSWYCIDQWSERLDLDIAQLKMSVRKRVSLRPHALDFLLSLQNTHKDVLLVTNAHPTTLSIKMGVIDLTSYFDRMVVSHDLKFAKEEQQFWLELNKLHPFDPTRTLLIDDTETVLDSANVFGIKHLVTLLQPDSQGEIRGTTRFDSIHHFNEIMPVN